MAQEPHSFTWKLNGLPNLICNKCGLIRLHNPFTDWCVSQGCDYENHPNYINIRISLTKRSNK